MVTALKFDDAAFAYAGSPALTGMKGEVESGEALALIGPNGSGKTTLLKGIMGHTNLVHGAMQVLGAAKAPKGKIGYVPQNADLEPTFPVSVFQVAAMGVYAELGWFKRLNAQQRARVQHALEQVGMWDKRSEHFGRLSGGQQQRVLVARAIVAMPGIILLDEPFNGLDQPNREALLNIIRWVKQQGIAVVVSTHDVILARDTCEKVALLAGHQIAFGPLEQVLTQPLLDQTFGRSIHVD